MLELAAAAPVRNHVRGPKGVVEIQRAVGRPSSTSRGMIVTGGCGCSSGVLADQIIHPWQSGVCGCIPVVHLCAQGKSSHLESVRVREASLRLSAIFLVAGAAIAAPEVGCLAFFSLATGCLWLQPRLPDECAPSADQISLKSAGWWPLESVKNHGLLGRAPFLPIAATAPQKVATISISCRQTSGDYKHVQQLQCCGPFGIHTCGRHFAAARLYCC